MHSSIPTARACALAVALSGVSFFACSSVQTSNDGPSPAGGGAGDDAGETEDGGADNLPPESGAQDAGSSAPSALADALPRLVSVGGPVLASPKVMAITYANDPYRADIEAFFPQLAASSAWSTMTEEYGVGPLTVAPPQHLAGNAPLAPTDDNVRALLAKNLTAGAWGLPDPSTLYAFSFPAGSILDDGPVDQLNGTGGKCCTDFDGYHDEVSVGGVSVPYAILCQCPGSTPVLEQLTVVASHEMVEAVTDPFWSSNPAYVRTDDAHFAWTYVTGGEIGDLCQYGPHWTAPGMTYAIQRMWSNAAAAAGRDPCVGAPIEPYYQTVPELTGSVVVATRKSVTTPSVKIAVGASGTVKLHVLADGAAGPFTLKMQADPSVLTFDVPSAPVNVGDEVTATIHVHRSDPSLGNAESFAIGTTPAGGEGPTTYSIGLVSQ